MTRDSLYLWAGIVVSVVMGLATLTDSGAAELGLPSAWLPYLRLASFVLGIVSAKLGSSPLPGKQD